MKRRQIGLRQAANRRHLAAFIQAVGMIAIERGLKSLLADAFRLGGGFLQTGDDARLFPFQHGGIEARLRQDGRQQADGLISLRFAAQGTQGKSGAIGIETAGHHRADIRQLLGDIALGVSPRAERHEVAGQIGQTGFFAAVARAAGGEIDADVEHRQIVVFDEHHARALRGLPMLDIQAGPGAGQATTAQQKAQQGFSEHGRPRSDCVETPACLPASAEDRARATVRWSSTRYFLATSRTCSAVTALSLA